MTFDQLGLNQGLLRAVQDKGYTTPSPIQAKAIPAILSGRDILATAQTGTGKTAGFTLPMLQKLSEKTSEKGHRPIRALILTPTRELAAQVSESVSAYSAHLPLKNMVVFGGVNINPQKAQLRGGVDILIATPGRLMDLHQQKALSLGQVEFLILDEADRMLDMGFIHDIRRVIKLVPAQRQNLMFSATFSKEIRELTEQILIDPQVIEVAPENASAERVTQQVYHLHPSHKATLLCHLIDSNKWEQVLVFTRTKHGADRLCKRLDAKDISCVAIHGNKSQTQRTKALEKFKERKVKVMVATDIAARGLDIKELPHVVNFELPNVPEDYVHRIGRTGRAGLEGHAISLVGDEERLFLKRIERLIDKTMLVLPMPVLKNLPNLPEPKLEGDQAKETPKHHRDRSQRNGYAKPSKGGPRSAQATVDARTEGNVVKKSFKKKPKAASRRGINPLSTLGSKKA